MSDRTESTVLTISQLTRLIKGTLEDSFGAITVIGEISNFTRHSSGHWYFTLKDSGAQLSAVMFRGNAMSTFFRPQNGMEVVCRGRITVYEPRGNYQIVVSDMQPRGEGALQVAFEKLKRKLHEAGLFDEARKRALPPYPDVIALVTSPTGAAIRDMISVLHRRNPAVQLLIVPVQVQGAGAAEQIAGGIDLCNEHGGADLIITGRGGGSIEDLWAFNEEVVARAIARSEIPVVSAVGHEVDVTISDYVADLRAATPSVAAELVVRTREEMLGQLNSIVHGAWKFVDLKMRDRKRLLKATVADRAFSRLAGRLRSSTTVWKCCIAAASVRSCSGNMRFSCSASNWAHTIPRCSSGEVPFSSHGTTSPSQASVSWLRAILSHSGFATASPKRPWNG